MIKIFEEIFNLIAVPVFSMIVGITITIISVKAKNFYSIEEYKRKRRDKLIDSMVVNPIIKITDATLDLIGQKGREGETDFVPLIKQRNMIVKAQIKRVVEYVDWIIEE